MRRKSCFSAIRVYQKHGDNDGSIFPREPNMSITDTVTRPPGMHQQLSSLGENVLLLDHIIAVPKESSGNPATPAFQ